MTGHRAHDWASTPEPQPYEQRVWHQDAPGVVVYVTSFEDPKGRPAVNINLIGGTSFVADQADRVAADIKAAAADARARFGDGA